MGSIPGSRAFCNHVGLYVVHTKPKDTQQGHVPWTKSQLVHTEENVLGGTCHRDML